MRTSKRDNPYSHFRGLTAVELLAASALATIMVCSVLGVLSAIARQQKLAIDRRPTQSWQIALEEQLRWDLVNSTFLEVTPTELRMTGFASRDFVTGEPTYRPAEIIYYLTYDGSRSWLVRREAHLDVLSNENWRSELVCTGVARIELERLWLDEDRQPRETEDLSFQSGAIPAGLRVMLFSDDSGAPWFLRDMILE